MDLPKSPQEVFQGNPISSRYQPVPADVVELHSRQVAAINALEGATEALTGSLDRQFFPADPDEAAAVAAGLAGTAVGEQFRAGSTDPDVASYLYLHDTGDVAVLLEETPSVSALGTKAGVDRVEYLETVVPAAVAITGGNIREAGESITPTVTWQQQKNSPFAEVAAQTVDGQTVATGDTSYTAPAPLTADKAFPVAITDGAGRVTTASVSLLFRKRRYWGASANAALTGPQIIALAGSETLAQSLALAKNIAASGAAPYVFAAWPAEWGDPSSVKAGGFALDSAGYTLSTVSITTAAGYTGNYRVLRLTQPQSGAILLEIS